MNSAHLALVVALASSVACTRAVDGALVEAGAPVDGGNLDDLRGAIAWQNVHPLQAECRLNGGSWRRFGNGCVDDCRPPGAKDCTMAEEDGCDCGPQRCTVRKGDLQTCVANPAWHGR